MINKKPTHRLMIKVLKEQKIDQMGRTVNYIEWIEYPNTMWNMGSATIPTTYNGKKVLEFMLDPLDRGDDALNVLKRFGLK